MVLAVGFVALAEYATVHASFLAKGEDGQIAETLAEAGANRGLARVSEAIFPSGDETVVIEEALGDGDFSCTIQQTVNGPDYDIVITSTGTGPKGTTRTVTITATKTSDGVVTVTNWRLGS